jgi:hypothetical protein
MPPLELVRWIRTQWASMYDFLDRIIRLKHVHVFFAIAGLKWLTDSF